MIGECEGCGNKSPRFLRIKFIPTEKDENGKVLDSKKLEMCDQCNGVKPSYPRDAAGNKVSVGNDAQGKFSYAIDAPITSERQLSEHLKKNNLIQK